MNQPMELLWVLYSPLVLGYVYLQHMKRKRYDVPCCCLFAQSIIDVYCSKKINRFGLTSDHFIYIFDQSFLYSMQFDENILFFLYWLIALYLLLTECLIITVRQVTFIIF